MGSATGVAGAQALAQGAPRVEAGGVQAIGELQRT